MRFLKRLGTLALILGCATAVCLGLTQLSDGVFRGRVTAWPAALAQSVTTPGPEEQPGGNPTEPATLPTDRPQGNEADDLHPTDDSMPREEPTEDEPMAPVEWTFATAVAEVVAMPPDSEVVPSTTPMPAETTPSPLPPTVNFYYNGASNLLNNIAEASATAWPNRYLLQDTVTVEGADTVPGNESAARLFSTLRLFYRAASGIKLPQEGYAWNVDYAQGNLTARLLPQDMVLRQMNGETEFMQYAVSIGYSMEDEDGIMEHTVAWEVWIEGFRMTADQWGAKLYADVQEALKGTCAPEERIITRVNAEGGYIRYRLEDVNDAEVYQELTYFVSGYEAAREDKARRAVEEALTDVMRDCRIFTPVLGDGGELQAMTGLKALTETLSRAAGQALEFSSDRQALDWAHTRATLLMLESKPEQYMKVCLPFGKLPGALQRMLSQKSVKAAEIIACGPDDAQTAMELEYLLIGKDGVLSAWMNGETVPLGYTELPTGLTLALEYDQE